MLDTGAEISVIDYGVLKYMQQLTRQVTPITSARIRPRSVTGDSLDVVGQCAFKLPGLPCHRFIVVRNLPYSVLLGADFCTKHRTMITFPSGRVQIAGKWVQAVPLAGKDDGIFALGQEYDELLKEYADVFGSNGQLGHAVRIEMNIETEGCPIRQRAYRVPLLKRQAVRARVESLLAQGIIRPSTSAWASPIVIVPKKSGASRLCCDYRKLDAVTRRDSHPLPNIRDIFDQLQGSSFFSLLDLESGYHQVKLDEASIPKTAFTCHMGLFEYVRMPFGLCNAPSVFQRLMNLVLHGIIGDGCLVYIDDIVIYGKSKADHDRNLARVLDRLRQYNLTTKLSKCVIGVRSLKLLGHIVDQYGIHTDPEKCEAISKMPTPVDQREVRRFLGASGYYRDLIPGYARLA